MNPRRINASNIRFTRIPSSAGRRRRRRSGRIGGDRRSERRNVGRQASVQGGKLGRILARRSELRGYAGQKGLDRLLQRGFLGDVGNDFVKRISHLVLLSDDSPQHIDDLPLVGENSVDLPF